MRNFYIIILILALFCSCKSNSIYYNASKKAIVSTNGTIKHLRITDQINFNSYNIELVNASKGTSIFYLFQKNDGYQISGYEGITKDSIYIKPNTKYLIKNSSYPDATNLEFEIEFDSLDNIKYYSPAK